MGPSLLLLAALGAVPVDAPPAAAAPEPAPAWVEVTPLGQGAGAARLLEAPGGGKPVELDEEPPGLALVCWGGERLAVDCEQRYLEPPARLEPALGRGVELSGQVLVGNEPAFKARIALVPRELRSRRFVTLPLLRDKKGKLQREVTSGRDGRFRTPEIAPGEYRLAIVAPGGRMFHGEPFTVPPRETLLPRRRPDPQAPAVLDLGRFAVDAGVTLEIFATGPGGAGLPGAKVGAFQQPAGEDKAVFIESETGPAGKAVLSGLQPDLPASVTCVQAGFRTWRQDFDAPPGAVECALEPLASIAGKVREGEERPVAGATVSLAGSKRRTATDADGRFSLEAIDPGDVRLVVAAPGFRVERLSLTLAPGEARSLPAVDLLPGEEVRGRVIDARSREPIAGASLVAVDPPGAAEAVSDAEGDFSIAVAEGESVRLTVSAAGYAEAGVDLDPASRSGEEPWLVELSPGGHILARVWDEDSEAPCQGCSLSISAPGRGSRPLVTDARGEALSEPLAEGSYSVTMVEVRSLGTIVKVHGGRNVQWAEVHSGRTSVVTFGERTDGQRVRLSPPVPAGWSLTARTPSGARRQGRRAADGSFEVRRPGPGAAELRLSDGWTSVRVGTLPEDASTLDLTLPQGEVRGSLRRGEEAADPQVLRLVAIADASEAATALTLPDGSFAVPYLPPGLYTLLAGDRPLRTFQLGSDGREDLGGLQLDPAGAR